MLSPTKLAILALLGQTLAVPVALEAESGHELEVRAPPTATFDVGKWNDIAELNCYAILCEYGGRKKWKKVGEADAKQHYTDSGASLQPFKDPTRRKTSVITPGFISPEEFPWRSLSEGGKGAHLFPVDGTKQSFQGNTLSNSYKKAGVNDGDDFEMKFTNYGGVYCKALFDKSSPDTSLCGKKEKTTVFGKSIFPGDYDYIKDPSSGQYQTFKHP